MQLLIQGIRKMRNEIGTNFKIEIFGLISCVGSHIVFSQISTSKSQKNISLPKNF